MDDFYPILTKNACYKRRSQGHTFVNEQRKIWAFFRDPDNKESASIEATVRKVGENVTYLAVFLGKHSHLKDKSGVEPKPFAFAHYELRFSKVQEVRGFFKTQI